MRRGRGAGPLLILPQVHFKLNRRDGVLDPQLFRDPVVHLWLLYLHHGPRVTAPRAIYLEHAVTARMVLDQELEPVVLAAVWTLEPRGGAHEVAGITSRITSRVLGQ